MGMLVVGLALLLTVRLCLTGSSRPTDRRVGFLCIWLHDTGWHWPAASLLVGEAGLYIAGCVAGKLVANAGLLE